MARDREVEADKGILKMQKRLWSLDATNVNVKRRWLS